MRGSTLHKKDLCLIGGGHSHLIVIRKLGMHPLPGVRVTLISNDRLMFYSAMLPGLIAGHYSFEDCHIDLQKLCQWAGIQFVRSEVRYINPLTKKIYCHQHPSLFYDVLSINIGSQPELHYIKGALEHGCPVKPIKQFMRNWQQWLKAAQASNCSKRIVIIGGGAAGIEILLAMHHKVCNATPMHAKFTLICADQTLLSSYNSYVQAFFTQHLSAMNVTIIRERHVVSINQRQMILSDNTILDYDFCAWAIHAGAQAWPKESGLKCDQKGFIQVDQYLCSVSHANVFAVGDSAAFMPKLLPKAGVYAVRQGPVLLKNIVAKFKNRSLLAFNPQKHFLSLLTMGNQRAVASWGPLFAHGRWVWLWKNHIDRAFMASFKLLIKLKH